MVFSFWGGGGTARYGPVESVDRWVFIIAKSRIILSQLFNRSCG